ncbi:RNA dependent RNA polymerase [Cooperia oncophora]
MFLCNPVVIFSEAYTFSDGVGMISYGFAAAIAKDMSLGNCVPSCYQFRFRGMKGVVAVNPVLDEIASWARKNGMPPPKREFGNWCLKLIFRPSQIKFNAKRTEKDSLEIVKYSSPIPVALNKPFICILDQVSAMQSYACHVRVTNRIEELLDLQIRAMARTMLREHDCRNKLKEMPRRIDIDSLSVVCGFQLSTEPFFRSLIKATIKFAVTRQLRKQQIQIPHDKGRTMLGVVDETGQLQYGQVFVQYTVNMNLKTPPPNASRNILTGKVLLTKNPCVVEGDVRIFNAVDIPDLRHLCDVVVFPIHGPRPHPDEMAGNEYLILVSPDEGAQIQHLRSYDIRYYVCACVCVPVFVENSYLSYE